jgi:hypothetical protein
MRKVTWSDRFSEAAEEFKVDEGDPGTDLRDIGSDPFLYQAGLELKSDDKVEAISALRPIQTADRCRGASGSVREWATGSGQVVRQRLTRTTAHGDSGFRAPVERPGRNGPGRRAVLNRDTRDVP